MPDLSPLAYLLGGALQGRNQAQQQGLQNQMALMPLLMRQQEFQTGQAEKASALEQLKQYRAEAQRIAALDIPTDQKMMMFAQIVGDPGLVMQAMQEAYKGERAATEPHYGTVAPGHALTRTMPGAATAEELYRAPMTPSQQKTGQGGESLARFKSTPQGILDSHTGNVKSWIQYGIPRPDNRMFDLVKTLLREGLTDKEAIKSAQTTLAVIDSIGQGTPMPGAMVPPGTGVAAPDSMGTRKRFNPITGKVEAY